MGTGGRSGYVYITTMFLLLALSILQAYPPGWSDDILLTPEDDKSRQSCDVDVDCFNNVWAVWDSATWISGTAEILYSKRDSMGDCLIPETPVSNNPTFSIKPRLAVDASNSVHFIWRDWSPQGDGIWHAKLANDGSVLVPSHLAVSGAGSGESTLLPEMVINKYNELYVIWDESPSGYNQMNFTRLDSLGNPIIEKIQVSLPGVYAYWPGIGVDSFANAHLAYRSDSGLPDRFTYSKLDRNGNVLISNQFYGTGALPTIIADQRQNMHIIYADPDGPGTKIKYLKLDQSGNILTGPLILSLHEVNHPPHMAMDSLQYLHVVWSFRYVSTNLGLMYTKMDTLGNYVIPPEAIVYPPYGVYPYEPRIAVDLSSRLHLVWKDQRLSAGDIFYKRGENEPGIQETNQSPPLKPLGLTVTPNPFTHKTNLMWQITDGNNEIDLTIFDIVGREVTDFERRMSLIDDRSVMTWDGTDKMGDRLPAGVYFVRLSSQDKEQVIPVVLLR